jgi:hypothetical protein
MIDILCEEKMKVIEQRVKKITDFLLQKQKAR